MITNILSLIVTLQGTASYADLQRALAGSVAAGNQAAVVQQFASPRSSDYLITMATRRGGLRNLQVGMVKAPADRARDGSHWAVFSTRQDIQEDHDVVCPVSLTEGGLKLGAEIPEWRSDAYRIRHAIIDAELIPAESRLRVVSKLTLNWTPFVAGEASPKSVVFRLGSPFELRSISADGSTFKIVSTEPGAVTEIKPGEAAKVGGIVIVNSTKPIQNLRVGYDGVIQSPREDKIDEKVAYITSTWVPSIGRLPHTTKTRVMGPASWILVSEGDSIDPKDADFDLKSVPPGLQMKAFNNPLPISFPKIVGGRYQLAAEIDDNGRKWRSYQLEPIEKARAERDVAIIRDSIKFFESFLGPFPFKHYAVFDADTYYGIESYSYTLLNRTITTRYTAHEIGHTYFGGMAPSAYTRDSWNEGVTQYVDSVLFSKNADRTLEAGLRTLDLKIPLTRMSVPHADGSATYWRGAYVMRMLENEIGLPAVQRALKEIVTVRRGRETLWPDLRQYFEASSGRKLDWFWEQWIESAEFPTINIKEARLIQREGKWSTFVTLTQSGPKMLRMKVRINLRLFNETWGGIVDFTGNQQTFRFDSDKAPKEASLDVFGLTLAKTGPMVVPAP